SKSLISFMRIQTSIAGKGLEGTDGSLSVGRLSAMIPATMSPERNVRPATESMATRTPKASARTPDISPPKAKPLSRQSTETPTEEARQGGLDRSETAARRVGYTKAVPSPSRAELVIHSQKPCQKTSIVIAPAWIHIPHAISHFRPQRSLRAPVRSCANPHTPG